MVNFSLEGKVALVTGGVYGIGFAIAKALHEAGAKIVYNCNTQKSMDLGIANYKEAGIEAKGYMCDVTDEAGVKAMVEDIEKTVGTIDILVNNAGIIKRIPMTDMAVEDFRRVVDIDLVAPFICAKAVIPGMIKKGHGKIINICSMMSELGRETVSAYAAAKGGLKMLTRSICSEYGEANISVTASARAISPLPRQLLSARSSPTAAAIPSTSSSSPRLRQAAGAPPKTSWARLCSSHPTLPIS